MNEQNHQGLDTLLDDLAHNTALQQRWELDPKGVAREYGLTERQLQLLQDGAVDTLISEGIAERHVQQMRVSW